MDTRWLDPSLALQFVETLLWLLAGLVAGACLVEVVCVVALLGGREDAPWTPGSTTSAARGAHRRG